MSAMPFIPFSASYDEARSRFRAAASACGAPLDTHVLPGFAGAQGEPLSMDAALLGAPGASRLLIVTSGTHGAEGYAGSAIQLALLQDVDLPHRLTSNRTAVLLVHAVNPYGFSHLRRVNEHNIDLNRNCLDFTQPLPVNAAYAELHPLLLPEDWPPTPDNAKAIEDYIRKHGIKQYQAVTTMGQYDFPDGLFYGGRARAWSQTMLAEIMARHGVAKEAVAWIDIHTGLGPKGHGEKISGGKSAELAMARALWGADVLSMLGVETATAALRGVIGRTLDETFPGIPRVAIALEFGTVSLPAMLEALRGDHRLHRTGAPLDEIQAPSIRKALREAFCLDDSQWQGMLLGQARSAVLQAVYGLGGWKAGAGATHTAADDLCWEGPARKPIKG